MQVVDPGDQNTWPADVTAEVDRLAEVCREVNEPETPSYELRLGRIDDTWEADRAFRDLLGDRPVALYHATRLLPHEIEAVRTEGLVVLNHEHRQRRIDAVIKRYGEEVGSESIDRLRHTGPLDWQNAPRLGLLYGVTPLQAAFDSDSHGMQRFTTEWGGESIYWVNESDLPLVETVRKLSVLSKATIVEAAVYASDLNDYTALWSVFVGQRDGWEFPWHQFHTRSSVPPERVMAILHEASDRWPLRSRI